MRQDAGMTTGARIRYAREAQALTVAEFAALVGVTHASVSMWENDHTRPRIKMQHAIASTLGLTWSELFRRSGELAAEQDAA